MGSGGKENLDGFVDSFRFVNASKIYETATIAVPRGALTKIHTPLQSNDSLVIRHFDSTVESFDRFNGHPAPRGEYHYHLEPLWLTQASRASLIGVLLDGFPVYGPDDASGQIPANLDVCHGHVAVTTDFPSGIYHYHVADDPPYIAGCFRGVPGTIRN